MSTFCNSSRVPARSTVAGIKSRQRGATLVVGLVMLVVLTLLVVSAIRSSNTSLRIVGNMQYQNEAKAATQQIIEQIISNIANFNAAPTTNQTFNVDINNDGTNDYSIVVLPPACKSIASATGYSYLTSPPKETYWDIQAIATDMTYGTTITMHQGVRVLLGVNATCPN